jgi:hypothetical protein
MYNPKARYLQISQKQPPHKPFDISTLQKQQKLRTDSMSIFLMSGGLLKNKSCIDDGRSPSVVK